MSRGIKIFSGQLFHFIGETTDHDIGDVMGFLKRLYLGCFAVSNGFYAYRSMRQILDYANVIRTFFAKNPSLSHDKLMKLGLKKDASEQERLLFKIALKELVSNGELVEIEDGVHRYNGQNEFPRSIDRNKVFLDGIDLYYAGNVAA